MPRPFPPTTFACPACHWKATTLPRSDALLEGLDWYQRCPRCGREGPETRRATQAETMLTRLEQFFRQQH